MNDDELASAFADLETSTASPTVDPAQTWEAITGEDHDEGETAALVEQVARDPAYAAEWRLGLAFAAEAKRDAAAKPRAQNVAPRWPWIALAAAAGLLLSWSLLRDAPPNADVPGTVRTSIGPEVESTAPPQVRTGEPAVLSWTPVTDAERYVVFVSDGTLHPLVDSAVVAEPRFTLNPAVVEAHQGETLLWRVEAEFATQPPIVSQTFRVRVTGP